MGRQVNDFPYETFAHISEGFTVGSVIFLLFSLSNAYKEYSLHSEFNESVMNH